MASVLVAHICETGVKLPTEGSGIVLFFFVSWMGMDFLCLESWAATVLLTCIRIIWFASIFSCQNRNCQPERFGLFTGGCAVRTVNSKRSVFTCYVSWLEKNMFWLHLIVHLLSRRQFFLFIHIRQILQINSGSVVLNLILSLRLTRLHNVV